MKDKVEGMIVESDKVGTGIDEFPTNGEVFHEAAVRICKKGDKKRGKGTSKALEKIYLKACWKTRFPDKFPWKFYAQFLSTAEEVGRWVHVGVAPLSRRARLVISKEVSARYLLFEATFKFIEFMSVLYNIWNAIVRCKKTSTNRDLYGALSLRPAAFARKKEQKHFF